MSRIGIAVCLAALVGGSEASVGQAAAARTDTTAFGLARRLLVAMHSSDAIVQELDSTFAKQRKAGNMALTPVFVDSLAARAKRSAPELVDSIATVYAATLSVADLRDLVKFYESPLGTRFSQAQIITAFQTSEIGQRWGMRLALDVMRDLMDKGLMKDIPQ